MKASWTRQHCDVCHGCHVTDDVVAAVLAKALVEASWVVLGPSTRPFLAQECRKYRRLMVLPGRLARRSGEVGRAMESRTPAPDVHTGQANDDFQRKTRRC